jgi:Ca2+-binding RTX toxin-like protein
LGDTQGNVLNGFTGNNTLAGAAGNDTLIGGAGDTLIGGTGDDSFLLPAGIGGGVRPTITEVAGGGNDTLLSGLAELDLDGFANVENLQLVGNTGLIGRGTAGNNRLTGSMGNDTLFGEAGNDTIDGSSGRDTLIGGAGDDTYILEDDGSLDAVVEGAGVGEGRDTVRSWLSVNLALYPNVENVLLVDQPGATPGSLTPSDSNAMGSSLDNLLTGSNGNNRLDGLAGADTLRGGSGNDTLIGGAGNDSLIGGAGNDSYLFDADLVLGTDTLDEAGGGSDSLDFAATTTRAISLNLGVATTQVATTQVVNANLSLTLGSATTFENVIGGGLADTLTGNSLANSLSGGGGNDTLTGGGGGDRFRFATAPNATSNRDAITDFSIAQGDRIELENAVFTALATGPLAASAFFIGTSATTADHCILYNSATGQLAYDADGNGAGAAVAFATLTPGLALTSSQFTVT